MLINDAIKTQLLQKSIEIWQYGLKFNSDKSILIMFKELEAINI